MWHHCLPLALMMLLGGAYCQEDHRSTSGGPNTLTLRKGDLPTGVRSILIEKTPQVTVEEDAVRALDNLVNITIEGVERLVIKRDGLALQHHSRLLYITIRNVDSLQVESGAFSGIWQQTATIRLHKIGDLSLGSQAFSYQTGEISPSISLQHVKLLNLDRDGFTAPLLRLALNNVTMAVCRDKSFGGNVLYNEFTRMTIDVAEAGCFHGRNDFTNFDIEHLKIKTVQPQAFSGTFNQLTIKDSEFTTIKEEGFNIAVTKIELTESFIKELLPNGLTVSANEKTLLERVHIDHLRQNGLVGLKMRENVKGPVPTLTIRNLELLKTESGSLAFSDCTKLQLTDLRLVAPWPRICPIERWTRALSGGGVSGQLSSAQYQVFFQLWDERFCLEDRWRKMPTTVESSRCKAGATSSLDDLEHIAAPSQDGREASTEDDTAESDGSMDPSHNRLLLWLLLGAVLVLMVVVGIVFMLVRGERNHGQQRSANVRDALAVMESLVEGRGSKMEKGYPGVTSYDAGRDSTRPSVEYHQYEEIRDPVKTGEGPLMTPSQADALCPRWSRPWSYFQRPEV